MIVCIDLETTWFDPKRDEIIEVALVKFDETSWEIIDTFTSLLNPKNQIPEIIEAITSIDNSLVDGAPTFDHIADEIEDFIWDAPILWHNVFFDIWFLQSNGINLSKNKILDTFVMVNFLYFKSPSLSLESLSKELWIHQKNAHRALSDVMATIQLFLKVKQEIASLSKVKREFLAFIFWFSSEENVIYMKDILWIEESLYSIKDFQDRFISQCKKDTQYSQENSTIPSSYKETIGNFPKYKYRENQEKLYSLFESTLWKDAKYIIEAPTWLWKTFSYLVPSLKRAFEKGEQIIISTKTKLLQDQIANIDLESISNKLNVKPIVTKLKGKKNYVSLFNFFQFLESRHRSLQEISFLSKITLWLIESKSWELDELNFYGDELTFVDEINIQSLEVLSPKNPFLTHEFYKKLIEKVNFSHIVVVNHSFVFSDLQKSDQSLLSYKNIIFDEAHSLEDIGTESLKTSYNKLGFSSYTANFYLDATGKRIFSDVLFLFDELDDNFCKIFSIPTMYYSQEKKLELIPTEISFESFQSLFSGIKTSLQGIKKYIITHHKGEYDDGDYIDFLIDFFEKIQNTQERSKYICYYSFEVKNRLSIFLTERHIGNFLDEKLWQKSKSVYLLSATMSVGESMDFMKNTLSLERFSQIILKTDFDYKKQAQLFIPNNLGDIRSNTPSIITFLWKFLSIVKGKTLVLFTSISTVKQVYLWVNSLLKWKEDIQIFAQWIHGGKLKILDAFKRENERSIVFWTDSFWEGIDIPWDDLTYLVIHKLPFPVPTDPIFLSRSNYYKNPFIEYAVPKTILKLKQWFWRLIRTESDTWYVILLDNRVIHTDWGKMFLSAFPKDIPIHIWTDTEVCNSIQDTKIK